MAMTVSEPTDLPIWDPANPARYSNPDVDVPGKSAVGMNFLELVPSKWLNWFWRLDYKWLAYIKDFINNSYSVEHNRISGHHTALTFETAKTYKYKIGTPASNKTWVFDPADFTFTFDPYVMAFNHTQRSATTAGTHAYFPLECLSHTDSGTNVITKIELEHTLAVGTALEVRMLYWDRLTGTFTFGTAQTILGSGATGTRTATELTFNEPQPTGSTEGFIDVKMTVTTSVDKALWHSTLVTKTFTALV